MTREEEKMYDGELGWAYQVSMRILAKLGDLFNADRLIAIESAHLSGVSYKTLGDAPIDFLQAMVDAQAKTAVHTTTNPSGINAKHFSCCIPASHVQRQQQILGYYEQMGVDNVLTCTPYYITKPTGGSHLAWAESSAVIYANSVLRAWTNREGGPSALAAALVGKTPDYGVHKQENRMPQVLVKLETTLETEADYGALGIFLGKQLKDKIPMIANLPPSSNEDLKQLGAAMASTGMTNIFHFAATRPPAPRSRMETISVEKQTIKTTLESMNTRHVESPNLVFIGCPHCSQAEIAKIAEQLKHRKIAPDKELWVCTSRHMKNRTRNHVQIIEKAGGKVVCDTCAVVTWLKDLGIDSVMTNSAKTAYYAPQLNHVGVTLAPLERCIEKATTPKP